MKKKFVVSLVIAVLVLSIGVAAFAATDGNGNFNFQQMLPFMQQEHPDVSDQQLEDMYTSCHGSDGENQNVKPSSTTGI